MSHGSEFDKGYSRVTYTTAQLYGSSSEDTNLSGQRWLGLSIDPWSHYRQLQCYFDDDNDPIPLVIGQVIRRTFQRVRLYPLLDCTNFSDVCDNLPAGSSTAPQLFPQKLVMQFWRRVPDVALPVVEPGVVQIAQSLALGVTGATSGIHFMGAHLPGAQRVLFWAHSEGVNNPVVARVHLWALGPERISPFAARSTLCIGPQLGTTLLVPSGTTTIAPQQCFIVDPAAAEYLIQVDVPANGSGTATVSAGLTAYFGGA